MQLFQIRSAQFPGKLLLLRGDPRIETFAEKITEALTLLDGTMAEPKRIPRAFYRLMKRLANAFKLDVVLVDLSPSIGVLNRMILMCSDGFLVPMEPDFFSRQAVNALRQYLPGWVGEFDRNNERLNRHNPEYVMRRRGHRPRFLGAVLTRFTHGGNQSALARIYCKRYKRFRLQCTSCWRF